MGKYSLYFIFLAKIYTITSWKMTNSNLSYHERAEHAQHPMAQKIFKLMEAKKTNISVSLDVVKAEQLIEYAHLLGPHICVLKTHIDLLQDFTPLVIEKLQQAAIQHQFLIFEDRKFADIGKTVQGQYQKGMYQIAHWSDFVNAHPIVGPGVVEGLQSIGKPLNKGLILIAQMSSQGNWMDLNYTHQTLRLAAEYPDYIFGFICMKKISDHPGHLHFTPGVQLEENTDHLCQQYRCISHVLGEDQSDIAIVGKGIVQASDPLKAVQQYQQEGWRAYQKRLS